MSSSRAPRLNTSDLVESLPGAQPSANPAARHRFEKRALQVYNKQITDNKRQAKQDTREQERISAAKYEENMILLGEMFPLLDAGIVGAMLLEKGLETAVEELMILSEQIQDEATSSSSNQAASSSSSQPINTDATVDPDIADFEIVDVPEPDAENSMTNDTVMSVSNDCTKPTGHALSSSTPSPKGKGPARTIVNKDDGKSWPVLTDKDGWEVANYNKLGGVAVTEGEKGGKSVDISNRENDNISDDDIDSDDELQVLDNEGNNIATTPLSQNKNGPKGWAARAAAAKDVKPSENVGKVTLVDTETGNMVTANHGKKDVAVQSDGLKSPNINKKTTNNTNSDCTNSSGTNFDHNDDENLNSDYEPVPADAPTERDFQKTEMERRRAKMRKHDKKKHQKACQKYSSVEQSEEELQ